MFFFRRTLCAARSLRDVVGSVCVVPEQLRAVVRTRVLKSDGRRGTTDPELSVRQKISAYFRRLALRPERRNNRSAGISKPEVIAAIHNAYFGGGRDIIETNTFNLDNHCDGGYRDEPRRRHQSAAPKLARACADAIIARTPEKPRFCCGRVLVQLTARPISPDVNDPAAG